MDIVLLGSGNVATHLAKALHLKGENIVQVYSRRSEHAAELAQQVNSQPVDHLMKIRKDADLYIIAVKDDVIETIAEALTQVSGTVVHTSGSTAMSSLSAVGKRVGVFYPLQTFSKAKALSFDHIPLCLEATDGTTLELLRKLASALSDQVYEISSDQRRILHLAAVFACNFPNYLYHLAARVLDQNDLDFNIIRPLIAETADKVMIHLPEEVQTGPAVRNDQQTLQQHLKLLQDMPDIQHIYQILSDSIKITLK